MQTQINLQVAQPISFIPTRGLINLNQSVYTNDAGDKVFDVEVKLYQDLDEIANNILYPPGVPKPTIYSGVRMQRRVYTYPAALLKNLLMLDEDGINLIPNWEHVAPMFAAQGITLIFNNDNKDAA